LIGEELDEQVRHYITGENCDNTYIVVVVGKGILMSHGKSEELTMD